MKQYLVHIYQINTEVSQCEISPRGSCEKILKTIILWVPPTQPDGEKHNNFHTGLFKSYVFRRLQDWENLFLLHGIGLKELHPIFTLSLV